MYRMIHAIRVVAVGVALSVGTVTAGEEEEGWTVTDQTEFGQYRFVEENWKGHDPERRFRLEMKDKTLWQGETSLYELPDIQRADGSVVTSMGYDVTGNGRSNIVISEFTLGAHCCWFHRVFELGREGMTGLSCFYTGDSGAIFKARDGFPGVEVITYDYMFHPANGCPISVNVWPRVVLRLTDDGIKFAFDRMSGPPPSAAGQARIVELWSREIRDDKGGGPDMTNALATMVRLVYTGHRELAWQLWERAWPPELHIIEGQHAKTLREVLADAAYADDLEEAYRARREIAAPAAR